MTNRTAFIIILLELSFVFAVEFGLAFLIHKILQFFVKILNKNE